MTTLKESQKALGDIIQVFYDRQLADELAAELNISPLRLEGFGITTNEFRRIVGCSDTEARRKLDALMEAGGLKRMHMRFRKGGRGNVYYK